MEMAKDPILKERMFGLTNSEGNHGEDLKSITFILIAPLRIPKYEVPL